jgi:RimJ/RimL family protein N-acetyltransferase
VVSPRERTVIGYRARLRAARGFICDSHVVSAQIAAALSETIAIVSPVGVLHRRAEREEDGDFRFGLFCQSRPPELAALPLAPAAMEQLMRLQFVAQTRSYRGQFPAARFDIIELDARPIGRIIVDRSDGRLLIVDQAIVQEMRNRGIGTAIMRSVMDEARVAALPVRLHVASDNEPSLRLYRHLGFVPVGSSISVYVELEWNATTEPGKRG